MHPEAPALEIHPDGAAVAAAAAGLIATDLAAAVCARGRATLAVSGGRTPLAAFARLADLPLPWDAIDVLQVDERCAPAGHADRNSVQLARAFGALAITHSARFHWLPLDTTPDARAAGLAYSATLTRLAGTPPVIDVLQLGLGADGHTASLFPRQTLEFVTPFVGLTPPALGWPRLTLTLPVLNAARRIIWLVTGTDKSVPLHGMLAGDAAVIASRVRRDGATVLADPAAADRSA